MKVLFVCKGNVARSQMAEAIYNKLTNSNDADSAGTHADNPGETLGQRQERLGSYAVEVMNDNGYNVNDKRQTQLTKEMIGKYDLIVGMSAKKFTPKWLATAPNYVYWKIQDPKGRGYEITERVRKQVEAKVREII